MKKKDNKTITSGNKLELENGKTIDFEYPIKKTLSIDGILIILLDKPFKTIYNENVFAIDSDGTLLWQIQKNIEYPGKAWDCPFIDIFINTKNELILYNWCDLAFIVNSKSGKILSKYEHR